ncbi:MAG: hypothetical protein EOP37_12150 [Rubrivivax sp.]|nr:MAG: hypothetical protein EOP37_12150 [Rubrivivax sp.]
MALEKKYILPAVIAGGCLILIGAWKLNEDSPSDAIRPSGVTPLNGVQSVGVNKAEAGASTSESLASGEGKLPPTTALPSGHEAAGTLNDQVERALAAMDGPMAANLAAKLKECEINLKILEVEGAQGARPNVDPAIQALRMERLQEYQRINASCQTVPGDRSRARLRLLDLAVQQGVVGAAIESFEAGSREPATLARVVSDASSGDVKAVSTVAMYDTKVFGITRDEQDAARYALKLASADPAIGTRVINYLKIAESYAVPNSSFDLSGISSAARTKGAENAERLKERLGKKAP